MQTRKLVVLDVDGVICGPRVHSSLPLQHPNTNVVAVGDKWCVTVSNDLPEFFAALYSKYDVAFYTSALEKNISPILSAVLSKEQRQRTVFCWYREHTHLDPEYVEGNTHGIKKYDTIKVLSNVWLHPVINAERIYNRRNTIICDDSARKTRFNPAENVVTVGENGWQDPTKMLTDIDDTFDKLVL